MIIRPIADKDLDALFQIAKESGPGFTSLMPERQALAKKIAHSRASFERKVTSPGDEHYLFVLEDESTGDILGTTGIEANAGHTRPLCHFRRNTVVHHSRDLDLRRRVETLTRCNHYTGHSEICSLYLRPELRRANAGKLLSKVRFLFMALHPERFSDRVIAEMRGVADHSGQSPFWNWLKLHFIDMDFNRATQLVGSGSTAFIDELMPAHPLYTCLMNPEARAVISQVHEQTRPALQILEAEGFRHKGYIDLFDAGPTVECALADIGSVKSAITCRVSTGQAGPDETGTGSDDRYATDYRWRGDPMIVTNTGTTDFRATVITSPADYLQSSGELSNLPAHKLIINAAMAEKLHIENGAIASVLPLSKAAPTQTRSAVMEFNYAH